MPKVSVQVQFRAWLRVRRFEQLMIGNGSPEILYEHQLVHGGVHARIEDPASVAGCGEPEEHVAEITSHCRGPAREERAIGGRLEHRECAVVCYLNGIAAGRRIFQIWF